MMHMELEIFSRKLALRSTYIALQILITNVVTSSSHFVVAFDTQDLKI